MHHILKENEVNPNILAAANLQGLAQVPYGQGVFIEWQDRRYFVSRWFEGRVYLKASRKRSR